MSIRAILQRRDAIAAELRQIHDAATGGALDAAAQGRWDALQSEADGLAAQERRQATIDEMDRRAGSGTPVGSTGDDRFDALAAQVNVVDVIRAQMGATDAAAVPCA